MTTGTGMDGQGSGRKRLSPWLVIAAVLVGMAVSSAGIGGFVLVGRWIGKKDASGNAGKTQVAASQQPPTPTPTPTPTPPKPPTPAPAAVTRPAPVPAPKVRWVAVPGTGLEFSRTEVTVEQYERCVREGRCTPPHFDDGECKIYDGRRWVTSGGVVSPEFRRADHPVVCVTYNQARTFAAWAGGRMPSRWEWQTALDSQQQPYLSCDSAVMKRGSGEPGGCGSNSTREVCSRDKGSLLCDMRGNVWEMVTDTGLYKGIPHQINCGGSWTTYDSVKFGGCDNFDRPDLGVNNLGFRIVR